MDPKKTIIKLYKENLKATRLTEHSSVCNKVYRQIYFEESLPTLWVCFKISYGV